MRASDGQSGEREGGAQSGRLRQPAVDSFYQGRGKPSKSGWEAFKSALCFLGG